MDDIVKKVPGKHAVELISENGSPAHDANESVEGSTGGETGIGCSSHGEAKMPLKDSTTERGGGGSIDANLAVLSKNRNNKVKGLTVVNSCKSQFPKTFLDDLRQTVHDQGQNTFATWYDEKGSETMSYSFQGLWEDAGNIAYHIRCKWNVDKGDRVVLCYNFGLHFFAAFFGCLRAGVVPALVYPPGPPLKRSLPKLVNAVKDCTPVLILTGSDVNILRRSDQMNPISKSRGMWPIDVEWKITDKVTLRLENHSSVRGIHRVFKDKAPMSFDEADTDPCDVAFLQYTSGSTGEPKGTMITFKALQANVKLMRAGHEKLCSETGGMLSSWVGFSWLPQYHDLGLIFAGVTPFASGWRMHMMSPITFLKKPLNWLDLMSRHRVSWSVCPNFAIHYVARKFNESKLGNDNPIPGLDLSSIRFIKVTAEPVRMTTSSALGMLSQYGLRKDWFSSGYGLAEHVVGCCWVRGSITSKQGGFIACGHRRNFHSSVGVQIVSSESLTELPDGEVGEVWLAGPSVAAGYLNKSEESNSVFRAKLKSGSDNTFLRTGDLGFFEDGYLFICGRIKDMIILNGVNYFPQDIEYEVQDASTAVRPGCVAAFSSDETQGDGVVEVVFEIRRDTEKDAAAVCRVIHAAVSSATGLVVTRLVAIKEKSIPKTTSGKIRRRATRSALHSNDLHIVHEESRTGDSRTAKPLLSPPTENTQPSEPFGAKEPAIREDSVPWTRNTMMDQTEAIVKEFIGLGEDDNLDRSSSIFDLGIDSMALAEISKTLESQFGIEVTDNVIIDHPTIADLSQHLYDKLHAFEAIMNSFFGTNYNSSKAWVDLGLFSVGPDQLRNAISNSFAITLDNDCFETYVTPEALKAHVLGNRGVSLKVNLPHLDLLSERRLPWLLVGWLQFLCSFLLIFMFALPIVPTWYFAKLMANVTTMTWIWLPFVVPVWMASFSLLVIIIKWAIICKYQEGEAPVTSPLYLRWWFVDRAVALWEFWTGRFLLDTPLIKLFYFLMGAKIHRRTSIKAFVREFDLVLVHQMASIEYQVHCRQFGVWNHDHPPSLRFRRIHVGEHSIVKGMLSLGSTVGDSAFVEKLSVVPEGACVPDNSYTVGNPAFLARKAPEAGEQQSQWLGLLKLFWLCLELYLFFGTMAVGQYLWLPYLNLDWRYAELLMWVMLIFWFSFSSILTSLIFKWAFIGKRRPGKSAAAGLWTTFADFAVDWHFINATGLFLIFTEFSRLWNAVWKLLGLDIDFSSLIAGAEILPSNVDLLTVKNSFLSAITICTKSDGSYCKIKIQGSSMGYRAHVGPRHRADDINIFGAIVFPYTHVHESIVRNDAQDPRVLKLESWQLIKEEASKAIGYTVSFGLFFCTLIPSYELWIHVLGDSADIFSAVPMLASALVLQMLVHTFLVAVVQFVALNSKVTGTAISGCLYQQYQTFNFVYDIHSFANVFRGSPAYNSLLRVLGVKFKGQALVSDTRIHEYPFITVEDKAIIDDSHITGHYVVHNDLTIGPCKVAGVMTGAYAANSFIESPETGPFKVHVGTYSRKSKIAGSSARTSVEEV